MDLIASRDAVVQRALFHVPFDGWSMNALRHACDDEGLSPKAAERLFPGGVAEAIAHFADLADRMMINDMAAENLEGMHTPARLKRAIQLRLTRWAGDREAIRRAVATMALPQYAGQSICSNAKTVDALWRAAGDHSADFSWYTKRLTLAPIYTATLLYWFEDASDDFEDTWNFLDRQFRVAAVVPNLEKRLKNAFRRLPDPRKVMPRPPRFGSSGSPFRR